MTDSAPALPALSGYFNEGIIPLPGGEWPYLAALTRLSLALALGLLIGMERERRGKEAGLRTFGFIALLGALGGCLGDGYAYLTLVMTSTLTVFLNIQNLRAKEGTELTTSAAMLITCMVGILCGKGHTLTPAAVVVGTTALLAWKERLSGFTVGLSESELRSSLVLAILAIVIYPALPVGTVGPWNLIEPRAAWATVILIAGLGLVNYVLWKVYGSRGVAITGFLGGLVNSSVTVSELAARVRLHPYADIIAITYRGVLLATMAMICRNVVLLFLLAPRAFTYAAFPYTLMLAGIAGWVAWSFRTSKVADQAPPYRMELELPFSLRSALKFGLIFLALHIVDVLMQKLFGTVGFFIASILGGMVSSASAVAVAANLASSGTISPDVAATGAVAASITSALANLPFVLRAQNRRLTIRLGTAMALVALIGVIGLWLGPQIASQLIERFPPVR